MTLKRHSAFAIRYKMLEMQKERKMQNAIILFFFPISLYNYAFCRARKRNLVSRTNKRLGSQVSRQKPGFDACRQALLLSSSLPFAFE